MVGVEEAVVVAVGGGGCPDVFTAPAGMLFQTGLAEALVPHILVPLKHFRVDVAHSNVTKTKHVDLTLWRRFRGTSILRDKNTLALTVNR